MTAREHGRSARRSILATAVVLIVAMAMPGTVAADTESGSYGVYGEHRLRDIAGMPGVRCHYRGDLETATFGRLKRVVVQTPVVFGSDVSAGEDLQRVGWRARLQRQVFENGEDPPTEPWITVQVRPIEKRLATELRPAQFAIQRFDLDSPGKDRFRIVVDMFWFDWDGRIVGGSAHINDHHRIFVGGEQFLDQARPCSDAQ